MSHEPLTLTFTGFAAAGNTPVTRVYGHEKTTKEVRHHIEGMSIIERAVLRGICGALLRALDTTEPNAASEALGELFDSTPRYGVDRP